ncbi:MAG: TIGR00266 family protein [Anaerolineales bacterium]|nr:TIGR00266 family protein [Anaerolineales bacterium]
MKYKIEGDLLQTLEIKLDPGESVYTESGGMAWMQGAVDMKTSARGGVMASLGRKLAGESIFMTTYTAGGSGGMIVFTPEAPGKVILKELATGESIICQKDSFMVAQSSVKLEIYFQKKLGAGLFGGEGFILQKVTGPGAVFMEIPGDVRTYTLQANETMRVDPGHIAMFEPTISYDIEMVKGVTNVLFGGEGLFLANLRGPGTIWLQSMPISNLARKLAKYIPMAKSN